MIVVPSIAPSTPREASRMLRSWRGRADLVEMRTDLLRARDFPRLVGATGPGVIVAHRSASEGGKFHGTNDEYLDVIRAASTTPAEYIDVEYGRGIRLVREAMRLAGRKRVVLSHHDHLRTPSGLMGLFNKMASLRPGLVKISVTACDTRDTAAVYRLLAAARASRQRTVAISMGEFGTHTRILQCVMGGYLSYSSTGPDSATAPGQIPHAEMTGIYRVPALDRRTKIFGLVGNPVVQSRGKYFHNKVFAAGKKNAVYVDVLVDDLGSFVSSIGGIFTGLSVTMPHKEAIGDYLDTTDDSARLSGSVNTVIRRRRALVGYNTDYEAYLALVRPRTSLKRKSVLILGTGAVAATAAAASLSAGARVTFCGRNGRRAKLIAGRFGAGWIQPGEVENSGGDLLVNATPVGMDGRKGPLGGGRIVSRRTVRNFRVVCDFVYSPAGDTRLVRDARTSSALIITGEDIFLKQAELQSRHFLSVLK